MALLRNREVRVLGPNGDVQSPIFTVEYPDGTREDTELKFIHMSESEHKQWVKTNPTLQNVPKVIDDKDHQEVLDSQNRKKIEEREKKGELNKVDSKPVQVPTYVKPADVKAKQ